MDKLSTMLGRALIWLFIAGVSAAVGQTISPSGGGGCSSNCTITGTNGNSALTASGGTQTGGSSVPALNVSQTWNNGSTAFTAAQIAATDTASASGSLLLDLQKGGLSVFNINKTGKTHIGGDGSGGQILVVDGGDTFIGTLEIASGKQIVWSNGADFNRGLAAITTGIKVTDGSSGNGDLQAASVRGAAVAFASVPGTPVEGMMVAITDSTTATWGATITGGGSNHVLGYYNGTNWTVAAK